MKSSIIEAIPGRVLDPKYPVVFDKQHRVMAEALSHGRVRVTWLPDNGKPESVVISPLAGQVRIDGKHQATIPFDPGKMASFGVQEMITLGQKLLEENGVRMEAEPGAREKLEQFGSKFEKAQGANPLELQEGDFAGIFHEDNGVMRLTIVELTGTPVIRIQSKSEFGEMTSFDGKEAALLSWTGQAPCGISLSQERRFETGPREKIIRLSEEDYRWLKDTAGFYEGKGSPSEGKMLLAEVLQLEGTDSWKSLTSTTRPRQAESQDSKSFGESVWS